MKAHWRVDLDSGAVRVARHAFAGWLRHAVSCANPLLEYELVFGELLSNAIRYGERPIDIDVAVEGGKLTIRVEDWGRCFHLSKPARGRGLAIVQRLASTVRVQDGPTNGCVVVATLDVIA